MKINKVAIKGLLFSVHNANMTMLIGNVTDIDTENVAEKQQGYKHYFKERGIYKYEKEIIKCST